MKIVFIHRGGPKMASFRYRCAIPAEELRKMGHQVGINSGEADIAVFSKPVEDDVRLARDCKAGGAKIVFDVCDPHFDHPTLGSVYRSLYDLADRLVFPAGEHPDVIPDPYEFEELPPHANDHSTIWFGHQVNLKDIAPYRKHCDRIITGNGDIQGATFYSYENLHRGLSGASMALFPTSKGQEYKTANRVINAIRMGVFPICDPHPSYEEFKEFIWTSGVSTGLAWAKSQTPQFLNNLVKKAQNKVRTQYCPTAIAKQWESFLASILGQDTTTGLDTSTTTQKSTSGISPTVITV